MFHQRPVDLQSGCRRSSEAGDSVAISVRQVEKLLCRFNSLSGGANHRFGEEFEPSFPIAGQTYIVQQLVVLLTVRLEIEAEVEYRLPQYLI